MKKSLKDHPFFKTVETASNVEKKCGAWGSGTGSTKVNKFKFFTALKEAHPFVFDRRTTMEKRTMGRAFEDFDTLVEDFSLPFRTSLYLMTDSITYRCPQAEGSKEYQQVTLHGYLIQEVENRGIPDPERFTVFEVSDVEIDKITVPCINIYGIDLQAMTMALRAAKAMDFEIFNGKTEAHILKETSAIMQFTDCISVKRIGVERLRSYTLRSHNIGPGFTKIKMDNLIHIADKVEYEYTEPLDDSKINWDHVGFWRGHWRAFYVKNSNGDNRKDEHGWNTVDYSRIGKDRAGKYCVPGYTWVIEHTKGDPRLADIKTRMVKSGK